MMLKRIFGSSNAARVQDESFDLCDRIEMDEAPQEPAPGAFDITREGAVSIDTVVRDLELASTSRASLADLTVPEPFALSEIVRRVRRWGVAILPGLVRPNELPAFETEFSHLMRARDSAAGVFQIDEQPASLCLRIKRDQMAAAEYPTISTFFAAPEMRTIAEACFGHDAFQFNHQLFVHRTDPMEAPPSGALHFDSTRMLKFWLYLSDGNETNGAMRASPGSNIWLRLLRHEYSTRLVPKNQIRNEVDEKSAPTMRISGPAGTLFIFDTDVAHGASRVAAGGQRRIIRAHCTEDSSLARRRKAHGNVARAASTSA